MLQTRHRGSLRRRRHHLRLRHQLPLPRKSLHYLLTEKDAEIAALKAQVEKPMTKAQVDKHKEEPKKKAARITMSNEAAGVPEDSKKYWVDVGAKKKKDTNVLVKSGAKPDSRIGLHWPGYCVEGCGCDVCVAKRKEPSKTAMLNLKRVSKKPST